MENVAVKKTRPQHEYLSVDWEIENGLLTAAVRVRHTCENTDKKAGWVERFTNVFACIDMPMVTVVKNMLTKQPLLIRTQNGLRRLGKVQALGHQNGFFLDGEKSDKVELAPEEQFRKLIADGKLTKDQILEMLAAM